MALRLISSVGFSERQDLGENRVGGRSSLVSLIPFLSSIPHPEGILLIKIPKEGAVFVQVCLGSIRILMLHCMK